MTAPRIALVVGVTGISGNNIARELLAQGWTVYGLSRTPGTELADVHHIYADVSTSEGLAEKIGNLGITHLFYCTWSRQATEAENCVINKVMVENTLEAVNSQTPLSHALLVTGLKHYLGSFEEYGKNPADTPFHESEPRLSGLNFYYDQEDALFAGAEKYGYTWSVHRPHTMIGYALGNVMNMGVTLAIYASLCKETGAPFVFPGSAEQYNGVTDVTDSRLLARHALWSSTTVQGQNQAFNTVNGEVFRWRHLWSELADYFALEDPGYPEELSPLEPRMTDADSMWASIVSKHGLQPRKASELASWWHTDADLGRTSETFADMSKSRDAGFLEYQTTLKSFTDLFDRLRAEKIIPS